MTNPDLLSLFKINWRLVLLLPKVERRKAKIFSPEDSGIHPNVGALFEQNCKALGFRRRPCIAIVPGISERFRDIAAAYVPFADSILIDSSTYKKLQSKNPDMYSLYVLSHELGHRKDGLSIGGMIKFLSIPVSGFLMIMLTDQCLNMVIPHIPIIANVFVEQPIKIALTGFVAVQWVSIGAKIFTRSSEFAADKNAILTMNRVDVLSALYKEVLAHKEYEDRKIVIQQTIREENPEVTLSPQQLKMKFYEHIAQLIPDRKITFGEVWKDGAYPTNDERFKRLALNKAGLG